MHSLFKGGPYKPHTVRNGPCMKHAPAILAAPALKYSMHRMLLAWITVVFFHFCILLRPQSRYTILEVLTVPQPLHFINILHSLMVPSWCIIRPCIMYTVYGRCGQYGLCMVHTLVGVAGAWFIRTLSNKVLALNALASLYNKQK